MPGSPAPSSWRDSGVDACVLEAAELGAGASTRSGGGVSGGTTIGKSFTGKGWPAIPRRGRR